MKLLDFLVQHLKKSFLVRKISNVQRRRANSITNLPIPTTKLPLFSTPSWLCFMHPPTQTSGHLMYSIYIQTLCAVYTIPQGKQTLQCGVTAV